MLEKTKLFGNLITQVIRPNLCTFCGAFMAVCPVSALWPMGEQPTLKKGSFIVWSGENELLHIPLRDVDAFVRQSCKRCVDFTAEYADISVGGIGCSNGYSTVVARTEKGLQLFKDAQQARYLETQELTPRKATSKSLTWLKRNGCEKT